MKLAEVAETLRLVGHVAQRVYNMEADGAFPKKTAGTWERLCQMLTAFGEMDVAAFCDFLGRCKHYEETGTIPTTGRKRQTKPKAPKPAPVDAQQVVDQWLTRLRELESRITDGSVTYQEIDATCAPLAKEKKDLVIQVAHAYEVRLPSKASRELFAQAIANKLRERKRSFERSAF